MVHYSCIRYQIRRHRIVLVLSERYISYVAQDKDYAGYLNQTLPVHVYFPVSMMTHFKD